MRRGLQTGTLLFFVMQFNLSELRAATGLSNNTFFHAPLLRARLYSQVGNTELEISANWSFQRRYPYPPIQNLASLKHSIPFRRLNLAYLELKKTK